MKCPICKADLVARDYHNDHIIMESESECANCQRYTEDFVTGSYRTGVKLATGWRVWEWHYDVSSQERGKINIEIGQAVKVAQREIEKDCVAEIATLKKGLGKSTCKNLSLDYYAIGAGLRD